MKTIRTKILLLSPFFYPHIGGSQRYMEELAVHLMRRYPDIRVDVLCYNTDNAPEQEAYRGLTIHRIPCKQIIEGQFAIANVFSLWSKLFELAKKNYDVVYTNTRFFDTTWWGWIFAHMVGAKSIVTDHVAAHPTHEKKWIEAISTLIDQTISKWALFRYDMVTATNTATKMFLENNLGLKRAIQLEYGGVNTRFFSPKRKGKRTIPTIQKYFTKKDVIVTFAGRLIWSKGVTYLTDAIGKMFHKKSKHMYFVLAGSGELEQSLKEKIHKARLDNHVFFTGGLTPTQVRDTLRATDVFIYPTHHAEGFPNAVLEAGASKCFVITTDNAGTNEIVTHGQTGYLIHEKSVTSIVKAIQWAIRHPKERKVMAGRLRTHIQNNFDWKPVSDHFYTSVLRILPLADRGVIGLKNYLKAAGLNIEQ